MDSKLPTLAEANTELTNQNDDLTAQILVEKDSDKLQDLTNLFKVNQQKKNIARMNRLSKTVELIDAEMMTRLESYPDTLDNKDLMNYMNTTQRIMDSLTHEDQPIIQINQQKNEIHVNESGLDKASRARVLDVVNSILNTKDVIDVEVEDVE